MKIRELIEVPTVSKKDVANGLGERIDMRDRISALNRNFARRVVAYGVTKKDIEEAVRKARKDVREARRSSSS